MSDSTFKQAAERTRLAADALAAKEAGKRRMATKDPGTDTSRANLNRVKSGGSWTSGHGDATNATNAGKG